MYTKQFTNPYPNGWDNPSKRPPITTEVMQAQTDALNGIDEYLCNNTGDYIEKTIIEDTIITVQSHSHTYVVLHFGDLVYNITFIKSDGTDTREITFHGGEPLFDTNSTYELSFLNLDCIYKKRDTE